MAEPKTKPGNGSVTEFIAAVEKDKKRADAEQLLAIMIEITGKQPVLWGDSIVGFGQYHYQYKSGREGDWPVTGFSPRKQNLAIYIMPGFSSYTSLLEKLGKHKTGASCLYINKLEDVDVDVLKQIISTAYQDMHSIYSCN